MSDHMPMVPTWLAMSAGAVVLIVLAGFLLALGTAVMDPQRRRIRIASTVLMMFATALLAYGFGVATPDRSRVYVMVWVLISSLMFMIILLAALDLLHSAKLHRAQLKEIRRSLATARAADLRAASAARRSSTSANSSDDAPRT